MAKNGILARLDAGNLIGADVTKEAEIVFGFDQKIRSVFGVVLQVDDAGDIGSFGFLQGEETDGRRIDEGELAGLVRRSDVILAPYQRFVGSSGVMLWAARAGKPLLTQDFGLLGRMVREHRLGLPTEAGDPRRLAEAIAGAARSDPKALIDVDAAAAFVAGRTPDLFASGVFESLASR